MSPIFPTLGLAVLVAGLVSANAGEFSANELNPQGRGNQGRGNARGNAQERDAAIRFQAMDRNNDRVITREEWRGSARSFTVHDWNGDGQLAGNEVRVGAVRDDRAWDSDNFEHYEQEYLFNDWTDRGFRALDHNRDNRITRDEWHFDREGFRRADHNKDLALSRAEFLAEDAEDDDRGDTFPNLDANRDGRIARDEWHGSPSRFALLDENRDGFISRTEMLGTAAPPELFSSVDMNRDRSITTDEWRWSKASFDRLDVNRDGRLSTQEFQQNASPAPARSAAYRAGSERGLLDGRQAGREERLNNRAWDLEGQTELEQADAGYQPGMGPRADYQAGYREAFRRAYREGWDQARK
jgi:Ca2+-binding EF-hand superfamily protein